MVRCTIPHSFTLITLQETLPDCLPSNIRELIVEYLKHNATDTLPNDILTVPLNNVLRTSKGHTVSYILADTEEEIEVKGYVLPPRKHWEGVLLVAEGAPLPEPAIIAIARKGGSEFRIWRGHNGFARTKPEIKRVYGKYDQFRVPTKRKRRISQEVEDLVTDAFRSDKSANNDDNDDDEDDETPLPPRKRLKMPSIGDSEADDKTLVLYEPPALEHNNDSTSHSWTTSPAGAQFKSRTTLHFMDTTGVERREKIFMYCNSVGKMFAQAYAAGMLRPGQDDIPLVAKVSGHMEGVCIVKGDEGDFEQLVHAVAHNPCWETNERVCRVEVRRLVWPSDDAHASASL